MEKNCQEKPKTITKEEWVIDFVQNFGFTVIPLNGKSPIHTNWQKTKYSYDTELERFEKLNYGIVLQADDLIIDVDARNGGRESLERLLTDIDDDLSSTFIVATGAEQTGFHFYLKKDPEIKIKKKPLKVDGEPIYPGIDFLSRGAQCVGPGSIHPETGKPYVAFKGSKINQIKEAPGKLISIIKRVKSHEIVTGLETFVEDLPTQRRYIKYLQLVDGAVEGEGGDLHTLQVAMKGRDFGLSPELTYDLMLEHFNNKCTPAWDPEDLKAKVLNAYRYAKDGIGNKNPVADFQYFVQEEDKGQSYDEQELIWDGNDEKGTLNNTVNNVVNYFKMKNSPLLNLFGYNELSCMIEFKRQAPWHTKKNLIMLNDFDVSQLYLWFGTHPHCRKNQFKPSKSNILDAINIVANDNKFNPIQDYLDDLLWDKKPRLNKWLTTYCQADNNLYSETIGRKVLIAAVARIYQPGVKFDHFLLLEGDQGIGKSSVCRILGGRYFGELVSCLYNNKETIENMLGRWVIEFSELEALGKVAAQKFKAFLTQQEDKVRLSYAHYTGVFPRMCIFIGTTNIDGAGYLSDTTGNRRFWPVLIRQVDLEGLRRDRDQLFAEAKYYYEQGEKIHIDANLDRDFVEHAREEVKMREVEEPWQPIIEEFIERNNIDEIRTNDVAVMALGFLTKELRSNSIEWKRICSVLRKLNFRQTKKRDGKDIYNVWKKIEIEEY